MTEISMSSSVRRLVNIIGTMNKTIIISSMTEAKGLDASRRLVRP